ncbi:family 1 glycosylhydrolase [Sphingobacterium sp. E70]|nr:family 1 glycosylhydrolase [Sphingobacterium sp. E70]ULT29223.1 family 1 glycosylhydrolase [Sphingobacterium sp. E70]
MHLTKDAFGKDFIWGVSTAAYQIEGAHDQHGKGPSIWDIFVKKRNRIFQNQHGDQACDFYNRYIQDLALMQGMHIPNYRFPYPGAVSCRMVLGKPINQVWISTIV